MANRVVPRVRAVVSLAWAWRTRPGPVIAAPFQIHSRPTGNGSVTRLHQPGPTTRSSGRVTAPLGVRYGGPAVGDPLEIVQHKSWTKQTLDCIKLRACKVQSLILKLLSRRKGSPPLYQGVWTALPLQCEAPNQARLCPLYPAPVVSSPHQRATVAVPVSLAQCQWDRCQVRTLLILIWFNLTTVTALSWKRKT